MVASLRLENFDNTEPGLSGSGTGMHSLVIPSHISPVPTIKKRTSNRGRKPARSATILSSPYKKDLENAQIKKSDKEEITKKIKKTDMTDRDSSDPNPGKPLSGNNTDSADDVAMRDETAFPTDEDAECFFCKAIYYTEVRLMMQQWPEWPSEILINTPVLENLEEEEKLKEARRSSMNRNSSVKRQLDDTLKPCKIQKKKKLSESSSYADDNIEQLTDSDDINIFPESEDENNFLMNDLSTITTNS
ncbi:hypothetical protein HHI36_000629 [Cryptolaemus montrouzieri]|uniref:Uncharacterized protein n=1 Tax=Cryptolaemus montrouzieri TaxID=559131 RepID=A0ABD2P5M6_9CUCU